MNLPPVGEDSQKLIAAVRRINDRWIVRGQLRDHASDYLLHLEATDAARLLQSCQLALELVRNRVPGEDPKPLFYAGLFSLASRGEIQRHLEEHLFTRAICLLLHGEPEPPVYRDLPEPTRHLADTVKSKIQGAIVRLFEKPPLWRT